MPKYKARACKFCEEKVAHIDYKDVATIRMGGATSQYEKIIPSYYSGTCIKHQKMLSRAVKNSRRMALAPYTTT